MKAFSLSLSLILLCTQAACQDLTATPPTVIPVQREIVLTPGQSAAVEGTNLTVTLREVVSDERCPGDVECVSSGPVTLSLSVQQGDATPTDFTLQTFTDLNGRSPNVQFEGITSRAEVGGYVIQVAGVIPHPSSLTTPIEASAYRVALRVTGR